MVRRSGALVVCLSVCLSVQHMVINYVLFSILQYKFLKLEVNANPVPHLPIAVFSADASHDSALVSVIPVCGACRLGPVVQEVALGPAQGPDCCFLYG